jgi:hypothetical protein
MPDTHLPLHDAGTFTEWLFPTLTAAQIARISMDGYRRPDLLSSQSGSVYAHEC